MGEYTGFHFSSGPALSVREKEKQAGEEKRQRYSNFAYGTIQVSKNQKDFNALMDKIGLFLNLFQ